jgi:heme exporter protein CcmD
MTAAPHIGFVIAAYAIAAIVLVGMTIAVVVDYRTQKKALERLEGRREGSIDP